MNKHMISLIIVFLKIAMCGYMSLTHVKSLWLNYLVMSLYRYFQHQGRYPIMKKSLM